MNAKLNLRGAEILSYWGNRLSEISNPLKSKYSHDIILPWSCVDKRSVKEFISLLPLKLKRTYMINRKSWREKLIKNR
jgi:hypothetical protein